MRSLPLLLLFLAACGSRKGTDSAPCTDLAAYSVRVTLTDLDGMPLLDGTATYTLDGGAPLDCDPLGSGNLICGWEAAGRFVITATAPGHVSATLETTVEDGHCHVASQDRPLVLEAISCPAEAGPPAAIITVTDEADTPVEEARVILSTPDAQTATVCVAGLDANSHVYTCPEGPDGEVGLEVSHPRYETHREAIIIDLDETGCDPITAEVAVMLVEAPIDG